MPRQLRIYFTDIVGNRITNENSIIADSASRAATERINREKFVFQAKTYDKRDTFYLIVEDVEEAKAPVYETYPFSIDIVYGYGD